MPPHMGMASRQVSSISLQDETPKAQMVHLLLYSISTIPATLFAAKASDEGLQTSQDISKTGCRLAGCGSSVPEAVLTNADLEKLVDTNDEWIATRTGIRSASDLGNLDSICQALHHAAYGITAASLYKPLATNLSLKTLAFACLQEWHLRSMVRSL